MTFGRALLRGSFVAMVMTTVYACLDIAVGYWLGDSGASYVTIFVATLAASTATAWGD